MLMLSASLFFIFGQFRNGPTHGYSAIFTDASQLKTGDSVRVAGIRVGTVNAVSLQPNNSVLVDIRRRRRRRAHDGQQGGRALSQPGRGSLPRS